MSKKDKDPGQAPVIDTDPLDIPSASFDEAMGIKKSETKAGNGVDNEHLLPSPEDIQVLREEVETLNKALAEAKAKADENWDKFVRKEAEFQNLVRRSREDTDKAKKFAIEKFASGLLDVIDSLEQGVVCCQAEEVAIKDVIEGLSLSQKAFLNCMEGFGIKAIDPSGENFDPAFHEALTAQESSDVAPNKILSVIQKGYLLHNRLLRPARVIVAKAPQSSEKA